MQVNHIDYDSRSYKFFTVYFVTSAFVAGSKCVFFYEEKV